MIGYGEEEIEHTFAAWEKFLHPEDRPRVQNKLRDYLAGSADTFRHEFRLRHKNGDWKWILSRGMILERFADGQPKRMIGTHTDITERKRVEEELVAYKNNLEEQVKQRTIELTASKESAESANRAKSVFLSNMSHELRTPLNAVLGFAQLMERDSRIPEDERDNLATIMRAGKHLLALINDVLEISRIEAGKTTIHNETVDLEDILTSLEDLTRLRAESKGLQFSIQREGSIPRYVYGDGNRLRQVLINLLGNAVKYTDHGEVTLRLRASGDGVGFEVADTGPGISSQDIEHIFQPFYQTEHGMTKGEGSGLGLTISREFVHLMGGELQVSSELGRGSAFTFTLPLRETGAPRKESAASLQRVIGLAPGQPPRRILVVEDDTDSRTLFTRMLLGVGLQVRAVGNGKQAVEAFESWRPDFIWMDMRMPVMDGYTATQTIRSLPQGKNVKIVALTASAFREDKKAILEAGCDDLLYKPIEAERMCKTMGDLLGLEYLYEERNPEEATAAAKADAGAEFSRLRPELLEELIKAAETLDGTSIKTILENMRDEYPEQARRIADLAEDYHYDLLIEYCQAAEKEVPQENTGETPVA